MDAKDTIKVLNDLIETSKDGEAGFAQCGKDANSPALKTLMADRSRECAAAAAELQHLVSAMGGKPETDTSVGGDLHRRWIGLKELVTGKDDTTILNECERGEDVAKKKYKEALEKDLAPNIRAVVEKQYQGVLRNHDQVKALRDAARAMN